MEKRMWTREQLEQRIKDLGLQGRCWGRTGRAAVEEIEQALGFELSSEIRSFGEVIGNLIVVPFELIVCGSEDGAISCVTETAVIRRTGNPYASKLVQIMDHAGESYVGVAGSQEVRCYDAFYVTEGQETQSFSGLQQFMDWLFEEAMAQKGE